MKKKLLFLIPPSIISIVFISIYLNTLNKESKIIMPQTENVQESTQWKMYENDYYSFKYPSDSEIQLSSTDLYTANGTKVPDSQGQSYYKNFDIRLYDLSKFPNSYRENPIDIFLYSFQQIDGGSFDSTLENLYIKRQEITGDFDVEIVLNSVWWQGGGPKTVSIKVGDNYALLVWSQLYEGYYDENGEFMLNETDFSGITRKMLQSLKHEF